jgi:short-subunit dehydrogenase
MLLKDRTAVIYGGSGAIGGAAARVFAREGAKVFLVGRTPRRLDEIARDIATAETAAFLASDRAGAMTAAVANLTCGAVVYA